MSKTRRSRKRRSWVDRLGLRLDTKRIANDLKRGLGIKEAKKSEGQPARKSKSATYKGKHFIFVYGTAKRGGPNHYRLRTSPYHGVRHAEGYVRVMRHGVPAITRGLGRVRGEVYEVSDVTLKQMDAFEGYYWPRRRIQLDDGTWAWTYVPPV